jgi:hypothetical protein
LGRSTIRVGSAGGGAGRAAGPGGPPGPAPRRRAPPPRPARPAPPAGGGRPPPPGGVGYIGARTIGAILEAGGARPWVAAFALRLVDYRPIAEALATHGFVTETLDRTFPQRRFVDDEERDYVLAELDELGIPPAGEEDGHYLAVLHLSRPEGERVVGPLAELVA